MGNKKEARRRVGYHARAAVHDPAIVKDGEKYYIFGTHMTSAKSDNLRDWDYFSKGVSRENHLIKGLFGEEEPAYRFCGKFGNDYMVWAPDVHYNKKMKKYVMYFCTTGSYIRSSLCFAVADQIEGPYEFVDTILHSGFDEESVKLTNLTQVTGDENRVHRYLKQNGNYENRSWPNCIDPNTFEDKEGRMWMVYGSWSGGIFLLKIDEDTGYPIHPVDQGSASCGVGDTDAYYGKKLLGGGHKSHEGPYILYDDKTDYYYLFVSFGWLAREGGYQIREFRSKKPDGPYVDALGQQMGRVHRHEGYGVKLMGNYNFPGLPCAYKALGHNSAFCDTDGKLYLVYHQRFDDDTEEYEPRVHQLVRTADDWLLPLPFQTNGENVDASDLSIKELAGDYYVVNHGMDISGEVHEPVKIELTAHNFIIEEQQHRDMLSNCKHSTQDGYLTLKLLERIYQGVAVRMQDENGQPVLCIIAQDGNEVLWAVKYE